MSILEKKFKSTVTNTVIILCLSICVANAIIHVVFYLPANVSRRPVYIVNALTKYESDLYLLKTIKETSYGFVVLAGTVTNIQHIYYFDMDNNLVYRDKIYTQPIQASSKEVYALLNKSRASNSLQTNFSRYTAIFTLLTEPYLIYCEPNYANGHYIGAAVVLCDSKPVLNDELLVIGEQAGLIVLSFIVFNFLARRYIRKLMANLDKIFAYFKSSAKKNVPLQKLAINTGDELELIADALNRYSAQLYAKNKQLADFSANVAHQLRSPLAAIQTSAEVLSMISQQPQIVEMSTIITNNSALAKDTIEALLTLAKVDSYLNDGTLLMKPCDILAIIRDEVALAIQSDQPSERFTINADVDSAIINAAPSLIEQLLRVLLSNAIKYSPPASNIVVALTKTVRDVNITVSDEGYGISTADTEHIFERFYRGASLNKVKGTGLGLAIALDIVKLHHGTLSFHNNAYGGASFTINLPKVPSA